MYKLTVILFVLICNIGFAQQGYISKMEKNDIMLGYDNDSTSYNYHLLHHKFKKNTKQLCFFDKFNDSISVFINGKMIISEWYKPASLSKLFIVIVKIKRNKPNYVRVVLNNAKKCIEFPLDMRYRFVELHYQRDDINENDFWSVYFTNNVPHRD